MPGPLSGQRPKGPRAPNRELEDRIAQVGRLFRPTSIHKLDVAEAAVHAKLEFENPVNSLKDRPAYAILADGVRRGDIDKDTTILESSSGNFACSLAVFCRLLGLRFIPVVDPRIARFYRDFLEQVCDDVVMVTEHDDTGGFLKTRLKAIRELRAKIPNSYWTNQYGNPAGMRAHYEGTGREIVEQVPDVEYVFVAVSSSGTIAGVSRRVKEHNPGATIVAVDAEGSVIFGGPPKKRFIPGIGSSVRPEQIAMAEIDDVVIVPEIETAEACNELLASHGLFVGGSTGSCFAALKQYLPQWQLQGVRPSVVFLCADRGNAYMNTVYDPVWMDALRRARLTTHYPGPRTIRRNLTSRPPSRG